MFSLPHNNEDLHAVTDNLSVCLILSIISNYLCFLNTCYTLVAFSENNV